MPKRVSPAERLAKLQQQTQAAKEALKDENERRLMLVGGAVVAEMERSPQLKAAVLTILRTSITKPGEKILIAPLLVSDVAEFKPSRSDAR